MPLDTSIPMQARSPQIEPPLNALARALQVTGMMDEADDRRAARASSNRMAQLLTEGADAPTLRKNGFLKPAMELEKHDAEVADKKSTTGKRDFDVAKERYEFTNRTLGGLYADPNLSKATAMQSLGRLVNDGILPGGQAARLARDMPDDPVQLKGFLRNVVSAGITPEKMLEVFAPKPTEVNDGATKSFRDTNPNSPTYGQVTAGAPIAVQMTPGERARLGVDQANLGLRRQELDLRRGEMEAGKVPPGYRRKADGTGLEPIPGGPAALGKALPQRLASDLAEQGQLVDSTQRFANSFQDRYGGKTVMGDWSNTFGRIAGDDTGQSQWWQDYQLYEAQVRNKLFGASLTTGEQNAWSKLAVSPRMHPDEIRKNLERRAQIEETGLHRLADSAARAGYNQQQIEALIGRPIQQRAPAQPAAPSGATGGWSIQKVN